uniref:Peptidoglycan-recognition protein LF-like n=1 Tax=Diabrotica virgifera virgifera TaxID=50390 RepID=A0A6P7HEG7_DIAVI
NNSSSFDNLFVSRIYWLAQSPATRLDRLHTPVSLIIIHHTATESCLSSAECKLQTRLIQSFHIENRYWSDIAYNFLIGGDGKIYEGRGWISEGAHTYNYNKKSLGIAFIGTFTNFVPHKEQINALGVLIEKGVQLGYVATDYNIFGARQLSPTESPGKSFYELIKTWSHWSEKVV